MWEEWNRQFLVLRLRLINKKCIYIFVKRHAHSVVSLTFEEILQLTSQLKILN